MSKLKILLLIISCSFGCNKIFDVACPQEDENQGLIVDLPLEDITCPPENEFIDQSNTEGVVVQTDDEYRGISPFPLISGDQCDLPDIDFVQYTLLGLLTQGTGCSRSYRRNVSGSGNKFIYEVTVRECGGCEPLELRWHWVTIPKISSSANVEFVTKIQKFNE